MNRYDRYPGDYLRDTLTLTPAQDGMYTRLMDYYYSTERAIPADEVMAAARCRNADDELVTQWVLSRFFDLTELGYRHERIEQEIAKARPRIEAARANGRKGGRKREGGNKPSGLPIGLPSSEPTTNPTPKLPSPSPSPSLKQDQKQQLSSSAAPNDQQAGEDLPGEQQTGEPEPLALTPPPANREATADINARKAERLAQITDEAITAWNASPLVKANGGLLPAVSATVGRKKRQQQVLRCLQTAREICAEAYGSQRVTAEFWADYYAEAAADDFTAGRSKRGAGHEQWLADFEYLTRAATMLKIYDRSASEDAA